jgi:hypothetical protein
MVGRDTDVKGGVEYKPLLNELDQAVWVGSTMWECVAALSQLSNEGIIAVVDHLLKCMDDADMYGEWAKRVSDGYHRDYESN